MAGLDAAQAWWDAQATKDAMAIGNKFATFRTYAVEDRCNNGRYI